MNYGSSWSLRHHIPWSLETKQSVSKLSSIFKRLPSQDIPSDRRTLLAIWNITPFHLVQEDWRLGSPLREGFVEREKEILQRNTLLKIQDSSEYHTASFSSRGFKFITWRVREGFVEREKGNPAKEFLKSRSASHGSDRTSTCILTSSTIPKFPCGIATHSSQSSFAVISSFDESWNLQHPRRIGRPVPQPAANRNVQQIYTSTYNLPQLHTDRKPASCTSSDWR